MQVKEQLKIKRSRAISIVPENLKAAMERELNMVIQMFEAYINLYRSAEERLINETNDLKKKLEASNGLLSKLAAEVEKANQEATSSSMLTSKIQFVPPKPADKPSSPPLSGDYGSGVPHPVPGGMGKYTGFRRTVITTEERENSDSYSKTAKKTVYQREGGS